MSIDLHTGRGAARIGWRGASIIGVLWLMPLPLASNRVWVMGLWLVLLVLLALAEVWREPQLLAASWNPGVPRGMRAHMGLLLLWTLYIALQLLPLPQVLREFVQSASTPSISVAGGFAPLTIDRSSTLAYLLKSCALLLLQWLLLRRFDNRARLEKLIWAWLMIGALEALLGVVLYATASSYQLFFTTVDQGFRATGTFVYHNHFAGYMELMLALGIGWMMALLGSERNADRRRGAVSWLYAALRFLASSKAPLRALLIAFVVALIASRSRMGNAAFFVALWVVGGTTILALHRGGRGDQRPARILALLMASILAIDVLIVGNVVGINKVMRRIEATHVANRPVAPGSPHRLQREESVDQRIAPGISALGMLRDHPVFGTGGGTFFLGFLPYRPPSVVGFYRHAHDDYTEFLVESGLLGILPLVAVLAWSQWRGWRQLLGRNTSAFERGLAFASVMGVLELLIHATVDFNFQNPTNAALFLWLLSLPHWTEARRLRRSPLRTPRRGEDAAHSFCNN
jgi:O-antigen ligase